VGQGNRQERRGTLTTRRAKSARRRRQYMELTLRNAGSVLREGGRALRLGRSRPRQILNAEDQRCSSYSDHEKDGQATPGRLVNRRRGGRPEDKLETDRQSYSSRPTEGRTLPQPTRGVYLLWQSLRIGISRFLSFALREGASLGWFITRRTWE